MRVLTTLLAPPLLLACYDRTRLQLPSRLLRSLLLLTALLLLPACGVDFVESDQAEMFSRP